MGNSLPSSPESSATAETARADQSTDSDVRSRLLSEAGPVFAKLGFDRATLREICGTAQVNVASVAYYFGDKMGLYRAVIAQVREARERRFPAPHNTAEMDAETALTKLVYTMLSRMLTGDDSGWETQLMMREMDRPTVVFQELVQEFFRPIFDQLKTTLQRLIGESVEEHVLEQLALSVVGQCLYYRIGRGVVDILIPAERREREFQIDSLCRHITAVTLSATRNTDFLSQKERLRPLVQQVKAGRGSSS